MSCFQFAIASMKMDEVQFPVDYKNIFSIVSVDSKLLSLFSFSDLFRSLSKVGGKCLHSL